MNIACIATVRVRVIRVHKLLKNNMYVDPYLGQQIIDKSFSRIVFEPKRILADKYFGR